jgi:para-nitrobenzyl esterase
MRLERKSYLFRSSVRVFQLIPRRVLLSALLLVTHYVASSDPPVIQAAPLQSTCLVNTAYGEIQGVDLGASCAFLGIPYAAAPVGNLRWKPPQPKTSWAPATVNAITPPSACGQAEDCLRVNMWVPKSMPIAPAPVIVWFHTGGFTSASANFAANNGQKLAEQMGVIVVAPNYRLGPLGFFAHAALSAEDSGYPSSGNYGFLDQRASLRWVRDNIAVFGGNADNVTIGGQSAGAHSVSLHLVSPGSAGLFHRAIMQSGYASTRWKTLEEAEVQGTNLANALGCTDVAQVLSCLRSKTLTQILTALPSGRDQIVELNNVQWSPVVDELEIPDQPRFLYQRAAFNRVPVIIGVTKDDGWPFVDRSFPVNVTPEEYQNRIETDFGPDAPGFFIRFPLASFASPKDALAQVDTDVEYACEATRIARFMERAGASVYLYSFEYGVEDLSANRVVHGLDTNFLFGNNFVAPFPGNHVLTPADLGLSAAMMVYLGRFAVTGNPDTDDESIVHWPAFKHPTGNGRGSDKYIVFDSVIREDKRLREQQCDFLEPFFFRSINGVVPASTP